MTVILTIWCIKDNAYNNVHDMIWQNYDTMINEKGMIIKYDI